LQQEGEAADIITPQILLLQLPLPKNEEKKICPSFHHLGA
jgi:hypothetical protein